jgi:hypothetical protein
MCNLTIRASSGNYTPQQHGRSYKKLAEIKSFKRELKSSYNMHFTQGMNLCHTDCIWIVCVCEFHKLSHLSVLISINLITLHYTLFYCLLRCIVSLSHVISKL